MVRSPWLFEQNAVVERRFYSMSPPRAEYVLTAKGCDLGPIVRRKHALIRLSQARF